MKSNLVSGKVKLGDYINIRFLNFFKFIYNKVHGLMRFDKHVHLKPTFSSPPKVPSCSLAFSPLPQPQPNTDLPSDAVVLLKFHFNSYFAG